MPGEIVVISMLGNADGDAPGGFLVLDAKNFDILGRWGKETNGMQFTYDFWYQPRQNAMVSSEWAAPNTFQGGFDLKDVSAGKYGHSVHFWDLGEQRVTQSIDLGADGMIPLEVRWLHQPEAATGFVGAALSSVLWRWFRAGDRWQVEKVAQVEPVETGGWPFPVPGLITDLLLSMDDRLPLPVQLAARRSAPVRYLRPGAPPAHRPGLAGRGDWARRARRPQVRRRAANAATQHGRPPPLRHQLALLHLG